MKRLEKIMVVQFFLFEKQEITLEEVTGIFGPNGSGKSSMIDAVQIAMLGGHSRWTALNAQADEKKRTTRSIRTYCLGQFGDYPEDRARDNATTYISLLWRDTVTNMPTTLGVCISASADRENSEVLGRYLLPGYELSMGDHVETVDGEERPREWNTFRQQLMQKSKSLNEEVIFNDASRYVNAVMMSLRGERNAPHVDSFVRSFKFGLSMNFDKSIDQIVRNDVLEPRPTNIKKFKEVTDSAKQMVERVALIEAKIADGKKVEIEFNRADEESRKAYTWGAMGKLAAVQVANNAFEQISAERERAEDTLNLKREELLSLDHQIANADKSALAARQAKESHASHKDYGLMHLDIQEASNQKTTRAKNLRTEMLNLVNAWNKASQLPELELLSNEVSPMIDSLKMFTQDEQLTRDNIPTLIKPLLKLTEKANSALHSKNNELQSKRKSTEDDLRDAKAALARIKSGRAPLNNNVQRLQIELEDNGLHPIPICDLVKITDTSWQPLIESFLGINLQSLLVSSDEEDKAFEIYRGMTGARTVYGVKLVRESRQRLDQPLNKGSVAEFITGESPAAVSYLRGMLNDIMRATTNREALDGKRTLTQDGMLSSRGTFEKLSPTPFDRLLVGAGSSKHLAAQGQETERISVELNKINNQISRLTSLLEQFSPYASEVSALKVITDHISEIERAESVETAKTKLIQGAANEEYAMLGEQEIEWSNKAKTLRSGRDVLIGGVSTAEIQLKLLEDKEDKASELIEASHNLATEAKNNPQYDHDFWFSQWDKLNDLFDDKHKEMVEHCEQQSARAEARMRESINKGLRDFGEFMQKHREQMSVDGNDWRITSEWLSEFLKVLIDTELTKYREEMNRVYEISQEVFRSDVAISLHENLEWLNETMDKLNSVLRTCPTFSNGERYRFKRTVRDGSASKLLQFVKDVATFGSKQDLFGGAGDVPEEFKQLLEDKMTPGAGSNRSPLDDYREFFDFDIEILREDPETKTSKVIGHLSKRLGSGSGGEHRSPLYVIAGAALASAYRLDSDTKDGPRLMLLDEAFNKMDITNIIATMRYLEALGLQVFMASPGENHAILNAFLHRYYDIARDPDNNTVIFSGHSISEEVREENRSDLPEFNPDLIQNEIDRMRAEQLEGVAA